jgi:hypothetical protein
MNYIHTQEQFRNQNMSEKREGSWPEIVDLIFDIVAHRDRLALKRRALGRHRRKFARRQKRGKAQ